MTPFVTPVTESHSRFIDVGAFDDAINASFEEFEDILGAVVTGLSPRGTWHPTGSFPPEAAKGDFWIVSSAGIVDGQAFAVGDWLIALQNSASTSAYAGNWARGDYSRVSRRTYVDVAALLASLEGTRGEGAEWRAGPYHYREASPAATDHHFATAGGQKLYVLPDSDGAFNLGAWGADLTGATPEHATLQAVIDLGSRAVRIPYGAMIRMGGDVDLRSDLALLAQGVTFTSDGTVRSINAKGILLGVSSVLNNNGLKGSFGARPASKGLFAAGDWVVLVNSNEVDGDGGPKGRASQLFRVIEVDTSPSDFDQLTFDVALGYHFTALGVADKATLHKVHPLTDVTVCVEALRGVVVTPGLVTNFLCEIGDAGNDGALQPDTTAPSANRRGRIRARVTGEYGASSGPNALVDLRGWQDLDLDLWTFGGREDGTRLYRCLDVRGTVQANSHASRGVHMYKVSGERLRVVAERGTATGNVEQILIDYCEDLDVTPRAVSYLSDNGVEVRGRARNVVVREPYIVAPTNGSGQACLNLHPASANQVFEQVRVLGGYIKGYNGYGLFAPDGCDGLIVDGLRVETWPGGSLSPLTVSTDGGISAPKNVLIQNCWTDRFLNFGCSSTLRGKSLHVRNCRFSIPSDSSSYQLANYWDGVMVEDLAIEEAPTGVELRILNSTDVTVERVRRPDDRARWNFGGSAVAYFDDPVSEDIPALEVALAVNARIFDSFTDPDGTPITSHIPEAGPGWSETVGADATVAGNALRVTTDGNLVTQRFPADTFVANLAIIRPEDRAWVDYSLVWDYVDASNFSEVRFTPSDGTIVIGDLIGGTRTARASFDGWDIPPGETRSVRIDVRGHGVVLSVGGMRVLTGTVNRATGSATGGWRRNGAGTSSAAVLASILVRS